MMNEPISQIMIKSIIKMTPDQTLEEADVLFSKYRIRHILVADKDNVLKGLISSMDMLRAWKKKVDFSNRKVHELMSKKLATLTPNDKVGSAAELFLDNRFHAIPIVDEDNDVKGIVTSHDIIRYSFKKEYPNQDIG